MPPGHAARLAAGFRIWRARLCAPAGLLGRAARLAAAFALPLIAAACGGSTSALVTYDLSAPRGPVSAGTLAGRQVAVATPAAIQLYQSDRIPVKDAAGAVALLPKAQLPDQLPNLLQARIIETFENASRLKAVTRTGNGVNADYQLNTTVRTFEIDAATNQAVVEISAKLVSEPTGRVVTARVFTARVPVPAIEAEPAVQALDRALSVVLLDIVRWISSGRAA